MRRIRSLFFDLLLLAIESIPMIYVLNRSEVFRLSFVELSIVVVASFYILNSIILRFTRSNQTLGDVITKIELCNKNGSKPKKSKLILRDLVIFILILNGVNGLFSFIGLGILCLPVGKHKETGHIIILIDVIFGTYYQNIAIQANSSR